MTAISCETLPFRTSDHWPLALTHENIFFAMRSSFSHTNWKAFEAILALLQTFWAEEQQRTAINEWYCQYVRFLTAVKNRLTKWKQKEKFRPPFPHHIIEELKEVRKIRSKYYHLRQRGIEFMQNFLVTMQQTHENKDEMFWGQKSKLQIRSLQIFSFQQNSRSQLQPPILNYTNIDF